MFTPVMPNTPRERRLAWGTGLFSLVLVAAAIVVMIHFANRHHVSTVGSLAFLLLILIIATILVLWTLDRTRARSRPSSTVSPTIIASDSDQPATPDSAAQTLPEEPKETLATEDSAEEAIVPDPVSRHHRAEAQRLFEQISEWAPTQPTLVAAILTDAWAADPIDGDAVHLVLVADDPTIFEQGDAWAGELGAARIVKRQITDDEVERRLELPDGLEVKVDIIAREYRDSVSVPHRVIYSRQLDSDSSS
jgi:hypothetical protein